jgi:DNA polymerase-3 subunit delta
MASPTATFYVFYGDDEPTLKGQLAEFCAGLFDPSLADLNTTRLDGSEIQPGQIEAAAGALPFLADTRLVLVDDLTESAAGREIIERLPEILPGLPDSTRLVFVETGLESRAQDSQADQKRRTTRRAALKKLVNAVENDPRGRALHFDAPKNPTEWIMRRAAYHHASIEGDAAAELGRRINNDLTLAETELEKLATYVNGQRPISRADVDLLTPYHPEASIFRMTDALAERDGRVALELLNQLIDGGEPELYVLTMIARQYRLLIQMREQLDYGRSASAAAKTLGVQDWIADRLARQARPYTLTTLERVYNRLLEMDVSIKTGKMDARLALEELIARLAREEA